jgi:hypothetical protein
MIPQSIIDDLSRDPPLSTIGTRWQLFTDRAPSSRFEMPPITRAGRSATISPIRARGDVSLENNGGFVQVALDLSPGGDAVDASAWRGIELDVFGNGEEYGLHLRTADLSRPWQSYRQNFRAEPRWQTVQLPFPEFVPHRTDILFNVRRLRRVGVVAIGRAFRPT